MITNTQRMPRSRIGVLQLVPIWQEILGCCSQHCIRYKSSSSTNQIEPDYVYFYNSDLDWGDTFARVFFSVTK